MNSLVAIWCGGLHEPMRLIHGIPKLLLVMRRVHGRSPLYAIVPWNPDLDWLEETIKEWRVAIVERCHTDERIAMRDLLVRTGADRAAIVNGDCVAIDQEEVGLAIARLGCGWEKYESPRVRAYPASTWLGFADDSEWESAGLTWQEAANILPAKNLMERYAAIRPGNKQ